MPKTDELRAYTILAGAPNSLTKRFTKIKRIECRKLNSITAYELLTTVVTVMGLPQRFYYIRVCEWQDDQTAVELSCKYFGDLTRAVDHATSLRRTYKDIPQPWN